MLSRRNPNERLVWPPSAVREEAESEAFKIAGVVIEWHLPRAMASLTFKPSGRIGKGRTTAPSSSWMNHAQPRRRGTVLLNSLYRRHPEAIERIFTQMTEIDRRAIVSFYADDVPRREAARLYINPNPLKQFDRRLARFRTLLAREGLEPVSQLKKPRESSYYGNRSYRRHR